MCRVLLRDVMPGAALSHSTAAAVLGIAVPIALDGGVTLHLPREQSPCEEGRSGRRSPNPLMVRLHCREASGRHRSGSSRVTVHRMAAAPRTRREGLITSDPVEVLCELSGLLGHADLVAAVDSVIGPGVLVPSITVEAVRDRVRSRPPFRHRTDLLRALDDARAGVESPGETFMRLIVVAAGFPEPEPNAPHFDPVARKMRRIDGAYRAQMIGMEYDGDIHRTRRGQWREDEARRDGLAAAGWVLRRMTGRDLAAPDDFLCRLHRACLERGVPVPALGSWRGRPLLVGAADHPHRP